MSHIPSAGAGVSGGGRRKMQLLGVSLALLFFCLTGFSQSNTARILGTVTDQSGGVVANVPVTVTNVQTGIARDLTTDEAGEYIAPNLLPGRYTVHVAATGFQATERQNIVLETGRDVRIDVQLSPGAVTQTIQVTEAIPLVDTTSATLSGTLDNTAINDLPLNGRNYLNLLVVRPGVESMPGGGSFTQSIDGLRAENINYFVDGLDNNEPFSGQAVINSTSVAGDAATVLPIDAIQEFNVEKNPPAEFGRKSGAVINVGLKSGTNTVHGTAYAFGRDNAWDARNFFNPPPNAVQPEQMQQWGGSVGGPIKKDKLFYFAAFEEQRYTVSNPVPISVPTTAPGLGPGASVPDAEAGLQSFCGTGATAAFCSGGNFVPNTLSLKLLPLWGGNSAPTGLVTTNFPNTNKIDNVLGKIDYHLNSRHSINGSYFFANANGVAEDIPVTQAAFDSTSHVRTQFLTSNWTWTPNTRWVNEARFGFTYYYLPVYPSDTNVSPTTYGLNTGVTGQFLGGLPPIGVAGLNSLGGSFIWPDIRGPNWSYDFIDHVSYLRGKHAFKFGFEILDTSVFNGAFSGQRGNFTFAGGQAFAGSTPSTGLQDFLAGTPAFALFVQGNPGRTYHQWSYGEFVQDDWRVTSRVTLNLGLRYQITTPISASNNLLSNWTPSLGLVQVGKQINSVYNSDHHDVGPRLGVVWDVTGKGTTVIRAGGGLYWDDIPVATFSNQIATTNARTVGIGVNPTGASLVLADGTVLPAPGTINTLSLFLPGPTLNWTLAGPVLPTSSPSACGNGQGANPAPCNVLAVDQNLRTPRVTAWNLSFQHAFSSVLSLEAAYVGNHGSDLPGIRDLNQINPQLPGELATLPCGPNGALSTHCELITDRPLYAQYPYLQYINFISSDDISNYEALQTTLTARNFHRMSFVFGYTYGHALDTSSFGDYENPPQNSVNPAADYGNSSFDIRHHFTISWNYNLPDKKSWGQLLQGWQLNSLVVLQSGLPWSITDSSNDPSRTGEHSDRWDFFGNPKDFTSGPDPIPFYDGVLAPFPAACLGHPGVDLSHGCYAQGSSAMVAPELGTFGTMGRNIFRDSGFRDWDMSIFKNWLFKERLTAQFRAEFFNILNHPNFANPGSGAVGTTDPSLGRFGCGCATPDVGAGNPLLGTGSNRALQLALKLLF
jgi:hypothetical protein